MRTQDRRDLQVRMQNADADERGNIRNEYINNYIQSNTATH